MNKQAELINKRLDLNLFNTEIETHLELNKFTDSEIEKQHIDDLIENGKPTLRLKNIVGDILLSNKGV